MIKIKTYLINNNITLTNKLLAVYITSFWVDIFNDIKDNSHLLLMCKVQFTDETMGYRTLGHLRKVNFEDKELFIEYLSQRLTILNDSYKVHFISNITFSYIIKSGQCNDNDRSLLLDVSDKKVSFHNFNNMVLPTSMNPSEYGKIIIDNYIQEGGEYFHRFVAVNKDKTYQIDVFNDGLINKVRILGAIDLNWVDTKVNNSTSNLFKREIKKSTIYFMDGEIVLRKQQLIAKPFRNQKVDTKLINNFYTMDIETITDSSKLIPYLICAYNGTKYITSYGKDQKSLFSTFFNQLLSNIKGGTSTIIYAHNLSGFDGIFLLRHLIPYGKVTPLLFNGKLMSINLKISGNKKSDNKIITFKDSYLLLPYPLRHLCKAFGITIGKGYFPFKLSNIFYTGILPKLALWTGIPTSDYDSLKSEYKHKMWSFQQESIKYCKLDCQCLHELLVKFNELIFHEFQINIHNVLTLPALAMKIYKTHFMPENTIYQMLGKVESAIRQSYTGGAVDVYIPHNRLTSFIGKAKGIFKKLYYYDVNSLYPTVMAEFDMPIGLPIVFEGHIRAVEPNAYGFFYCKITSPVNLEHPLLQRRIKTSEGVRTIAGLGTWEGWICSSEMDNAIKYGYQFEIFKGYQFETGDLFSAYINKMYNLRLQFDKTDPMNLIAKLLMNSLYGKFGMKLESTEVIMYDTSTEERLAHFKDMIEIFWYSIKDYVKIDNTIIIIRNSRLTLKYDEEQDMYHGQDINIAIASAITAGARVKMSFFKNNPLFNLYYSDTDSGVIDTLLPDFMIGNKLGQLKLEHTINKAIFLAPKVYGLVDTDGSEIIKVKGISNEVASQLNIADLEQLLLKDSSREFTQEKWFKKVIEGEITVSDIAYTLKITSNKRLPIYLNDEGIEIYNSTKPYNYDEITSK